MALPAVDGVAYQTPTELRNQILADIRYSYAAAGLTANVEIGSDHYFRAQANANRISIAIQNNKLAYQDLSPLTAVGTALEDLCRVFGITARPASKAAGFVTIACTGTVTIPSGYRCTEPAGEVYETITANTVTNGELVEVSAVNSGTAANVDAGTIVRWNNSSVGGLQPNATVDAGELDGGEAEDDDETLRARLIRRLAYPGVGGTIAQVASFAENASAAVEQAFVYAAARGPGSYDVAVTKAGGDRAVSASVVTTVEDAIDANMPGHADINVTAVAPQRVDVIINATLPLPVSAGGAGGGWRDATPWPSTADSALPKVTAKTGTTITVNSTSLDIPSAGKRFGIWDPVAGEMLEFTIQTVSGSTGAYVITPDPVTSAPLTAVVVGAYVSAGAVNLVTYASEFLEQLEALGPGEKTTLAAVLPRGRRQPSPDTEKPSALTTLQLAGVTATHSEILNLEYAARYATGTTTAITSPSIPATTADPPKILVLKYLAFRRQT